MEEKTESKKKGTNEKKEEVKESNYKVVGSTKADTSNKEEKVKGKVTIEEKAKNQMNKGDNKTEKKSNKTIIIIAIILIIVVGVIAVIGMFGSKVLNKMKLDREMNELFSGNLTEENMDIKTTGDYAVIETAIKEYYKEVTNTQNELMKKIEDERVQNMLSIENYQSDGPEFTASKEYINTIKGEFNALADKIVGLMNSEVIMAQIEDKNLNEYYTNLYKDYFFSGEDLTPVFDDVNKEIEDTKEVMNNLYDNEIKILDFLSENKSHWEIQGSRISFDSSALLAQYNSLKVKLSIQ